MRSHWEPEAQRGFIAHRSQCHKRSTCKNKQYATAVAVNFEGPKYVLVATASRDIVRAPRVSGNFHPGTAVGGGGPCADDSGLGGSQLTSSQRVRLENCRDVFPGTQARSQERKEHRFSVSARSLRSQRSAETSCVAYFGMEPLLRAKESWSKEHSLPTVSVGTCARD